MAIPGYKRIAGRREWISRQGLPTFLGDVRIVLKCANMLEPELEMVALAQSALESVLVCQEEIIDLMFVHYKAVTSSIAEDIISSRIRLDCNKESLLLYILRPRIVVLQSCDINHHLSCNIVLQLECAWDLEHGLQLHLIDGRFVFAY
jgi:hypothetical protein